MTVQFRPCAGGDRSATMVIHQNLPQPDAGTTVALAGSGNGGGDCGQQHSLTVNRSAAVTVTSRSRRIVCGDTCTAAFTAGVTVTLTATYDSGGGLVRWDGCDLVDGDTCQVHMIADRTISAGLP
jgi:hypothetical protein